MGQKGRILIVDDQIACTDILCRILRREYEVETAVSGKMCLMALPDFKPHLVLLDIMMPGMDGYETCRRIKFGPLGNFIQVILVSGMETTADRVRGYDALADDYVVKPFDHDELLSKVRAHFRARNIQAAPEPIGACETSVRQLSLVNQMNRILRDRLVSAGHMFRTQSAGANPSTFDRGPSAVSGGGRPQRV
jgi:DNA-binding response OmpR family regulator